MNDNSLDAVKGIPFLDLNDKNKVMDWLKMMKSIVEKTTTTPWKILVRARVNDPRALSLISILPSYDVFSTKVQELVQPEQSLYTKHFGTLVEKITKPDFPTVQLESITNYTNDISDIVLDKYQPQPLPQQLQNASSEDMINIHIPELRERDAEAIMEVVCKVVVNDVLLSMLSNEFVSQWDRSMSPSAADPIDIALWAEALGQALTKKLKLDVTGRGKCWESEQPLPSSSTESTPTRLRSESETPTKKRRREQSLYCSFCKKEVFSHTSESCYKNPKNSNNNNNNSSNTNKDSEKSTKN